MPGAHPPHKTQQAVSDDELARGFGGVDRSWYLATYRDVAAAAIDPVDHYLKYGWREGRDPRADFSTRGYLALNGDVARAGQNPLIHYLRSNGSSESGRDGARQWHLLWKRGLVYPKFGEHPPTAADFIGTRGRRKILFIGHEATRTGAPLILLALMEMVQRQTDAELFLVLAQDGPLLDAYRRIAHVAVIRDGLVHADWIRTLVHEISRPAPEIAICNSASTWPFAEALHRADFPHLICLLHERISFYPADIARNIHRHADRTIFPAHAVKTFAERSFPEYRNADVIPQGLLKDTFGLGDRSTARRVVRDQLGLAADARIVLGCGSREPRKGLDLFVQLAARVRSKTNLPFHFVWLGGDERATEFKNFVRHDIALLGLGSQVSLIAETADPEPYFLAADVFALTSRDDPFPCVVHEAMACALPVIVFEGAGGAPEALADDCGIIVPYLDIEAMAQHICSVIERPADFVRLGVNAERRVRSTYRFSDYARQILKICEDVMAPAQPAL